MLELKKGICSDFTNLRFIRSCELILQNNKMIQEISMKSHIKKAIAKSKYIKKLCHSLIDDGTFPAGHFYSPIPDYDDVISYVENKKNRKYEVIDVNIDMAEQLETLKDYQVFYGEMPFADTKNTNNRFYFDNEMFSYGDAIFLYSFIRKNKPRKIVEVGSGFSSAVIIDTIDQGCLDEVDLAFIEPYPQRLHELLKEGDLKKYRLIAQKVQDVPLDEFTRLSQGDLLFIDSSHIVKCGSDLHYLMFEVLPRLSVGVFVHFHDIFYPFEYPDDWLLKKIYWNENYFVRAFLANNASWDIYFFNDYVARFHWQYLADNMPKALLNPGGGLYIRKTSEGNRKRN